VETIQGTKNFSMQFYFARELRKCINNIIIRPVLL
jgi:hypothetical protein